MSDNINFQSIFDYIDKNNDKLIKLFEARVEQNNDEMYERFVVGFASKEDFQRIEQKLDFIMTMVKKLDEERLVTVEWVKRIEMDVEKIKKHLQIA